MNKTSNKHRIKSQIQKIEQKISSLQEELHELKMSYVLTTLDTGKTEDLFNENADKYIQNMKNRFMIPSITENIISNSQPSSSHTMSSQQD
jgi:septation ring formation regulator EzrA